MEISRMIESTQILWLLNLPFSLWSDVVSCVNQKVPQDVFAAQFCINHILQFFFPRIFASLKVELFKFLFSTISKVPTLHR